MNLSELNFEYPENLIATEPQGQFRAMWVHSGDPQNLTTKSQLFELFKSGDVLVVNDSQVLKRRVHTSDGIEILFLDPLSENQWEVLYPVRKTKGQDVFLPGNVKMSLVKSGRPQVVQLDQTLSEIYFEEWGELALPPYIQKARGERKNSSEDNRWYQTAWAENPGSYAAPTASLHFSSSDIEQLKQKGVKVCPVTLHVGLGTFLPVTVKELKDHKMHFEKAFLPKATAEEIKGCKKQGARVWALGTTVTRTLEAWSQGELSETSVGDFSGSTDIFIRPGYEFNVVDVLMTNFHQPKSTLLALVGAFAGLDKVKSCYKWAIENQFKLFSYGDLSIWTR